MSNVFFKIVHENGKKPFHGSADAAGYDLYAAWMKEDNQRGIITYGTGIACEIPEGHFGLLFPRSSIYKKDLILTNGVGVLDPDYRGEIKFVFMAYGDRIYQVGDRIGQIVIAPRIPVNFIKMLKLSETARGEGGYGSTGA